MAVNTRFAALALAGALAVSQAFALRMAIFSDVHVTPGNANDEMLRRAVVEVNDGKYDLVIVDGDLTNEGSDEQIANVKAILDGIRHPLYVLPGNHENNWSQSATKTFIDTFGNDRFVTEIDSFVLVGINCGPYMKMGDGHIKQEDLHWLRATLNERVTPGKRVISFNHYPIRKDDLDNWVEYADLLKDYPVIAHINGHYHNWQHYKIGDIDGAMVRALDMKNDKPGYTIVDIDDNWTHIYNKRIGQKPEAQYAFANHTAHRPLKVEVAESWQQPEGFDVRALWTDSASVFTRVAFDDKNIYFGTSLGDARAVDRATGKQIWQYKTPASLFARATVLDGGKVAVPGADGIYVLDAKTGNQTRVLKSKEGPYVADGVYNKAAKAYIQGGYKRIERHDPRSGKLVWTYDSLFNYCQAAPYVDAKDVIFGAWDTNLRCLDTKSGKLRWVWNNGKAANMLGPGNVVPVVTDNQVIIVAPDRFMTAIDRATGKTIWRNNSHKYRESLGVSADKSKAYAKTMDGELVAVATDKPEFTELWTLDLGLGYEHAPCIVAEHDGVVYVGSRRGIVTAVDPAAQKVLWQLPLGVSEINGFDIDPATGTVFVSLIEGKIFAINKK